MRERVVRTSVFLFFSLRRRRERETPPVILISHNHVRVTGCWLSTHTYSHKHTHAYNHGYTLTHRHTGTCVNRPSHKHTYKFIPTHTHASEPAWATRVEAGGGQWRVDKTGLDFFTPIAAGSRVTGSL